MDRLRTFFLSVLASLLAGAPPVHAAGEPAIPAHPTLGTWTWSLFGGSCTETWQYRTDRTVLGTSGQQVAENTYDVARLPDTGGFYKLVETLVRQNDKKDCSGALPKGPGEQSTRFIQFNPHRDKLLVCQGPLLKACFGPLTRVH